MAFCRSVFTVLLLSVVCNASVPVLMWGDVAAPNLKYNPLETTSPKEFGNVLTDEIEADTFTVIFTEKSLSVEDFSSRNAEGLSSYPYLHSQIKKSVYLPSVRDAVPTLRHVAKLADYVKQTDNGVSVEIEPENANFLFIDLQDAKEDESRADMLRRHDLLMQEKVAQLKENYPNVIAIYTARFPSWVIPESHLRYRRQADNSNNTADFVLDGLRLYAKSINVIDGDQITPLGTLVSSTTVIGNLSKTMNTTLNFDGNSIVLNFNQAGGYWFFESVTLNNPVEDLTPDLDVHSLIDFAYRCGQNVTFGGNGTRSLYFEDLKVQPVFQNTNESSPVVFGDSFNCVGFFSAPIWSGLFVVFILLAITFYGIMMMMDIRTMDRFDDPKGKTITINAGE